MHFHDKALLFLFCPLYIFSAASREVRPRQRPVPSLRLSTIKRASQEFIAGADACPSPRTKSRQVCVGCSLEDSALKIAIKRCVVDEVKKAQIHYILINGATAVQRDALLAMPEVSDLDKCCKDSVVSPDGLLKKFGELLEEQERPRFEELKPEISVLQINIEMQPLKRAGASPAIPRAPSGLSPRGGQGASESRIELKLKPKKETVFMQNCSLLTFDAARLLIMGDYPSAPIEDYLCLEEMQKMIKEKSFELIKIKLEAQFEALKAVWFIYEDLESSGLSLSI